MESNDPEQYLETMMDKFVFRVKRGYLYSPEDVWVNVEDGQVRVGITDFLQRLSGDVAFAKFPRAGTSVEKDGSLAQIETIKTTLSVESPFAGVLDSVNPKLTRTPELINEDPYGEGWLAIVKPQADVKSAGLLDAETYFALMQEKIAEEQRKQESLNAEEF